jgi:hypothetical protein
MSLGLILYLLLTQPVYNMSQLGVVIVRKEVGPIGVQEKNLQSLDSTNQKHTMKNICARKIGVMSLLVTGCCYD